MSAVNLLDSNRLSSKGKGRKNCPSCKAKHQQGLSSDHSFNTLKSLNYKPQLTYDDYVDEISNSMMKYRVDNAKDGLAAEEEKEKCLTVEDEYLIKKVCNANRSLFANNMNSINSESALKVTIPEIKYLNPYQSVKILNENSKIVSSLNQNFLQRQKELFDDAITSFESYTMKYKVKMPKIKVCNVFPKISQEIPVIDKTDDEKKKKALLPLIPSQSPRLFAYYRYPNKNFPEGREQFSLCIYENKIVLVGGISSQMKTMSLWKLELDTLTWEKLPQKNFAASRFGHTCVCYQNKLFLFGGRTKYANSSLLTGFDIYSFQDNSWIMTSMGKSLPKLRRNHVADLIGQQMIIHGGVGDSGEVLSDSFLLNMNPIKWVPLQIDTFFAPPALFGHTSAVVVPKELLSNYRFSIYKYPDTGLANDYAKVKEKGWYIFGGKAKEEGGLSNSIYILLLGRKPLEWTKPKTNGTPPCPRYYHSMNFFERGNFLIVHGGRNDECESNALNDTFIFNLLSFDWMRIDLYSQLQNFSILTRCGHSSIIYCKPPIHHLIANKLIIFGGMNNNNYLGSTLLIVNLDFNFFPNSKSPEEIMISHLKSEKNDSVTTRHRIERLRTIINKNQLGIVTNIDLPKMK